ncbi:DUF3870 domain-containing protein [Peptoniphilus sp. AGMB00490]|uniref:DUF3870 domain-containing protein n=1 Tax=Peptoniphilus faecalis TaxID=2731255 RepID=A0A848RMQ4_9FIRM|nr:DUF3870 domain-containing protein [Peptoniphilus faecalis]NMW85424.1 DUF3870 domain-containing protein [Peptoniphilus faecalis]
MKNTLYLTGEARTNLDNAITKIYGTFYMAFEIEENGVIVNMDSNATLRLTRDFIRGIFIGKNIADEDLITDEILKRYNASSTKAIITAYKDALQRYKKLK